MFSALRVLAAVGFAALAAACSTSDANFLREGVGTELAATSVNAAALQNVYVEHLCSQAGLSGCPDHAVANSDWPILVQAGFNDIDERCDAYLAWIDSRRRSTGPVLKQISDIGRATLAIMRLSGAGAAPITIAGLAFGLATDTFTNVNSRLLFEINHSTVQAVVLNRQQQFRFGLPRNIDNRPAAIYALRSYLRICMPFTIETDINTTISLVERGGNSIHPLVSPANVNASIIRSPGVPIQRFQRAQVIVDGATRIGPFEQQLRKPAIKDFQKAACLPVVDGVFSKATREGILSFLVSKGLKDPAFPSVISDRDGTKLRDTLDAGGGC